MTHSKSRDQNSPGEEAGDPGDVFLEFEAEAVAYGGESADRGIGEVTKGVDVDKGNALLPSRLVERVVDTIGWLRD